MFIIYIPLVLLVPLLMLVIGIAFAKHPPEDINGVYGYRTGRSRQSPEAWKFAHRYFGSIWVKLGPIMAILSVIGLVVCRSVNDAVLINVYLAITIVQVVVIVLTTIPTERALKDKFGN